MEPTEEAIISFINFTSTTRDQAIAFLKANNLDSQKAINAYFEDPSGPQPQATGYYNDNKGSAWDFAQDNEPPLPPLPATAPPSRPPSRIDKRDAEQNTRTQGSGASASKEGSGQGLSIAEREEKELQQAVAMSLGSRMGQQETGVTSNSHSQLSKATRDHYEQDAWAMTLFNSEEVINSPEPEDRKRVEGEPAFIRPNPDGIYLGGFLTILHNIPLAREALLLRNKPLFDYGHEPQWWNGQAINLPKIVTVEDGTDTHSDWEDIIHETQRLMSFMDSTKRAFGSSDSLTKIKSMSPKATDSEDVVTRFMEAWYGAAIKADPDNPLTTIFTSHAFKKELGVYDEPEGQELFAFEPPVEKDHDQTLYEVLDAVLWADRPGQELDDTWIENLAEVLVIKLDAFRKPNPVDVEIPSVFYPDRYLSGCREIAREFRLKRQQIQGEVLKLEKLLKGYNYPEGFWSTMSTKELFEKAAEAVISLEPEKASGSEPNPEATNAETSRITEELKAVAHKIDLRLKELEQRKQSAVNSLREVSKTLTEPPKSPSEPPIYKYTLRGLCTQPHVTYVLSDPNTTAGDLMQMDSEPRDDYQWWRISFSAEDGKTRQAEKKQSQGTTAATQGGDTVGYTIRKVSEIDVLRAAREEWGSVLLVYASENAMNAQVDPAPPQLQSFVHRDNDDFGTELEHTPTIIISDQEDAWASPSMVETKHNEQPQMSEKSAQVNVFDYEVTDFDDEKNPNQEMQERGSASLRGNGGVYNTAAPEEPDADSQWNHMDEEDTNAHIEHAK